MCLTFENQSCMSEVMVGSQCVLVIVNGMLDRVDIPSVNIRKRVFTLSLF